MANSIVFSNSAEELKTAVFGYDGNNYLPLKVNEYGELNTTLGTIDKIDSITNGTISNVNSITNGTINVTELNSITSGTIDVTQISSLTNGTISNVTSIANGTINVNLNDRYFTQTSETLSAITLSNPQYSTPIDTSKMQDITWYVKKIDGGDVPLTVKVAVSPEENGTYVLVGETATIVSNGSAKVLSSSYYMHYTKVYLSTTSTTEQSVQVFFNGRY